MMTDITNEVLVNRMDTSKDKKVDAKELLANISKLSSNEYTSLATEITFDTQAICALIEPAVYDVVGKNNLLTKTSLTVPEIKILKLFFLTVPQTWFQPNYYVDHSDYDKDFVGAENSFGRGNKGREWFKQWIKWYRTTGGGGFSFISWGYRDIAWTLSASDTSWLNSEGITTISQVSAANAKTLTVIEKSIEESEEKQEQTRPLAKKLKAIKDAWNYTYEDLESIADVDGILYDKDIDIKEMTSHEASMIGDIFENVLKNPNAGIGNPCDTVWHFIAAFKQDKRSGKVGETDYLKIRVGCINNLYAIAQRSYFDLFATDEVTAKNGLYKLCLMMVWWGLYGDRSAAVQEDIYINFDFAKHILTNLMYLNGTMGKLLEKKYVDVLGEDDKDLSTVTVNKMLEQFCEVLPAEMFLEFGFANLLQEKYLEKKWSELDPIMQSKMVVLKKIIAAAKAMDKEWTQDKYSEAYKKKIIEIGTDASEKQSVKINKLFESKVWESESFREWLTSAEDMGLTGKDADIYNLYCNNYIDNFRAWKMSYETNAMVRWVAKTVYMIWATAVTTMIFPPAGVGIAWSAIAVGTVSTLLTQAMYNKFSYNSFREWFKDVGSQRVFDVGTAFLSMKFFGPIFQTNAGLRNNVKNITQNLGIAALDFSIWTMTEAGRQTMIGNTPDFLTMVEQGWALAAIFIVMSWWLHVKTPELHLKNKIKLTDDAMEYLMKNRNNTSKLWSERTEQKFIDAYTMLQKQKVYLEWELNKIQSVKTPVPENMQEEIPAKGTKDNQESVMSAEEIAASDAKLAELSKELKDIVSYDPKLAAKYPELFVQYVGERAAAGLGSRMEFDALVLKRYFEFLETASKRRVSDPTAEIPDIKVFEEMFAFSKEWLTAKIESCATREWYQSKLRTEKDKAIVDERQKKKETELADMNASLEKMNNSEAVDMYTLHGLMIEKKAALEKELASLNEKSAIYDEAVDNGLIYVRGDDGVVRMCMPEKAAFSSFYEKPVSRYNDRAWSVLTKEVANQDVRIEASSEGIKTQVEYLTAQVKAIEDGLAKIDVDSQEYKNYKLQSEINAKINEIDAKIVDLKDIMSRANENEMQWRKDKLKEYETKKAELEIELETLVKDEAIAKNAYENVNGVTTKESIIARINDKLKPWDRMVTKDVGVWTVESIEWSTVKCSFEMENGKAGKEDIDKSTLIESMANDKIVEIYSEEAWLKTKKIENTEGKFQWFDEKDIELSEKVYEHIEKKRMEVREELIDKLLEENPSKSREEIESMLQKASDNIKGILAKCSPRRQFTTDNMEYILKNWVKTFFDTGTSRWINNKQKRIETENILLFGNSWEVMPNERPRYWYFDTNMSLMMSNYGDATMLLHADIIKRMTITWGDSLNNEFVAVSPLGKSVIEAFFVVNDIPTTNITEKLQIFTQAKNTNDLKNNIQPLGEVASGYIEAQYLWLVEVDDINEFHIHSEKKINENVLNICEKNNIKIKRR